MSARNNKNPFGDEDDSDNYKFGNRTNTSNFNSNNNNSNFRKPGNTWGSGSAYNNDDDSLEQIQQKIGKTENDSLESTQRALRMLNETHEIGVGAAQVKFNYQKN
jgi:hypothetical protein